MMDFLELAGKRSSCRSFTEETVTEEQLDKVLTAGLMAPTGTNRQEIFFTVAEGNNPLLEELEREKCRQRQVPRSAHNSWYEAPVLILLSAEDDFRWSAVDAGIAVENMSLAAEAMGLGSLIIGSVYDAMRGEKRDYFAEKFRIPEGKDFQVAIAIGHKAAEKQPHSYDKEKQVCRI